MELTKGESFSELVQADTVVLNHTLGVGGSMSLNCAVELGIPDLIDSHGRPMSLSELARSIPIPPEKEPSLGRLMRLLVTQGIFEAHSKGDNEEETAYFLTPVSRLLLTKGTNNMSAFVRAILDPALVKPWHHMKDWFKREGSTPFKVAHDGKVFGELTEERPEINDMFNEAMACDAYWVLKAVVTECAQVFRGLKSLIDVGGGTGISARIIAEAFPEVRCTVFDLPHVVATLPESKLIDAVGGDMFDHIPPADATFLKSILRDWSDEDCVKILKRCKEAIPPKEKGGKVIIVDMVLNSCSSNPKITETNLFFDLCMMIGLGGKGREEYEWQKIFNNAGFEEYKIFPMSDIHSVIELYY